MYNKVIEKVDSYFSAGYDSLFRSGWDRIKKDLAEIENTGNQQLKAKISALENELACYRNRERHEREPKNYEYY